MGKVTITDFHYSSAPYRGNLRLRKSFHIDFNGVALKDWRAFAAGVEAVIKALEEYEDRTK